VKTPAAPRWFARPTCVACLGILVGAAVAVSGCGSPAQPAFEDRAAELVCDWNEIYDPDDPPPNSRYFQEYPIGDMCEPTFVDTRQACGDCEFNRAKAQKCLRQLEALHTARDRGDEDLPATKACNKVYQCEDDAPECSLGLHCSVGERTPFDAAWLMLLGLLARPRRRPSGARRPQPDPSA
jgi:hypothetical protein